MAITSSGCKTQASSLLSTRRAMKYWALTYLWMAASTHWVHQCSSMMLSSASLRIKTSFPITFVPILLNLALKNMEIGWEKISESKTSVESTAAKNNSISFYGLQSETHCQVLGPGTNDVKNAHIWPYNNKDNLPLIDLEAADIDDPKNVLRLHSDIEYKFDRFLLTFVPSGNDFILQVLDPSIKSLTLKDTNVTFGDIDGHPLLFPNCHRPWRHILVTHSLLAHRKAREKGYLEDDQLTAAESCAQELMEFSLDEEAQARIKMALGSS